ncbi:MAG: hypothetical protein D6B26_00690 [Spirochaetaceae bacterium]|nr:MAG: hypothetical protein D6B26_00690 [Spirochaetaceae bacterium]
MFNKTAKLLLLCTLVIMLVTACNQNPVGIFATMEAVERIELENAMPNEIQVTRMAYDGSDTLFAAASQLKMREFNFDGTWEDIALPEGYHYASDVAIYNSRLAIIAVKNTSGSSAVFTVNLSGVEETQPSWQEIELADDEYLPYAIYPGASELYIAARKDTATTDSYKAFFSDGSQLGLASSIRQIVCIAEDPSGNVYTATSTKLYRSTNAGSSFTTLDPSFDDYRGFSNLLIVNDDNWYLTSKSGKVRYTNDTGSSWNTTNAYAPLGAGLSLSSIIEFDGDIYVGTLNRGYAVLDGDTIEEPDRTLHVNFYGSDLYNSSVLTMMAPGTIEGKPVIFTGTASGLWRGTKDGSKLIWGQE